MTLLALSAAAPSAHAAGPYDPETNWRMLTTPRFHVVYPDGYGELGVRAAHIGESLWPFLAQRYLWSPPGRITIVLDDQTDFANGSARVLPARVVTVFLSAPIRTTGLEDYDDWLHAVIAHELAHVFHLDMAYGLAGLGRLLLGQTVIMNAYAAAWSTEGLAVYEETMVSGAGRGRSSYVDMVLRMAALEDRFPSVDQAYRAYPHWPFGNVAYFFGGRFQLWLAERFGEEGLLDYHRGYATSPVPYLSLLPAHLQFGATIESLWGGFAEEAEEEALAFHARVRRERPSFGPDPTRLTFHGGESVGPRVTPDGRSIVYSATSPVDGPRVRMIPIDGGDEQVLLDDTLSQAVAFTPDGSAFYFQQTEINQRFYAHDQLLRYDLRTKKISRVDVDRGYERFRAASGALRARDPDVSPSGDALVFVQNHRALNRLVLAEIAGDASSHPAGASTARPPLGEAPPGEIEGSLPLPARRSGKPIIIRPRVLVPGEPDVQMASPRFSPDGSLIALSVFRGGRRDVVVIDRNGALVEPITRDRAQDVDPTWSPDGRWLVFSSDRSRVYDLYAFEVATGRLRRLTHLVSGAFQPSLSPDGETLVFRGYTSEGFDVFRIPFRPEAAPEVPRALEAPLDLDAGARVPPARHPAAPEPPRRLEDTPLPEGWTLSGYDPLPTLVPRPGQWNLLPSLFTTERELILSLTHFGRDALETHGYSLTVRYGTFSEFLGGTVAYVNDTLEPTFTVSADADAITFARTNFVDAERAGACPFGGLARTLDDRRVCFGTEGGLYVERRLSGTFGIGLPLRQRHLISLSYTFEERAPLNELAPGTVVGLLPSPGRYARVRLGYSYANVRRFPYSVSLERGPAFSAALSALSKGLGGEYEQILVTADGRYYWDLPYADNHVLAARLTLGLGGGPDLAERFRLGGVAGSSALSTTTQNFYPLRGLVPAVVSGTGQISGTLEYRAPLFRVDRGVGTAPLTLSVVHASAFLDAGRVFNDLAELAEPGAEDRLAASAGVEVRADVLLAFVVPLTFRLGFAWPFVLPSGLERERDTQELYFQIGSAF